MLSDEKYHLDEISNAYCQSKDLECVLVRIFGKSLFIYPKTTWFSVAFHLLPSIFLSPVKWSTVICQKRKAKYILIDELEIRGEAQTTQGGSWKQEWIAYPNWEWKKLFWRFKEKWLQNKGICLWNLIHMHIIIFPENCCSNLCIPANSYEMKKCGTYVTLLNVCLWNYTKEFSVCFLLLLLLVSIPIETAADQNKTKTK